MTAVEEVHLNLAGMAQGAQRTIGRVSTEMSLYVLAYNMKRVIKLLGSKKLIEALQQAGIGQSRKNRRTGAMRRAMAGCQRLRIVLIAVGCLQHAFGENRLKSDRRHCTPCS
jgi:hypothetical protein